MEVVPHLYGILDAFDDPEIEEVVCMKAAQVAWTTAILAYMGKLIDTEPCVIIGMFTTQKTAGQFDKEKFTPTVQATPALDAKVDTSGSRKSGNSTHFKNYPGGFAKYIGSNAISEVKGTSARVVIAEEPDDSAENLKEQGDSILLLWERTKRKRNSKRILGGTPKTKGVSKVDKHLMASDMRVLPIKCHDCGEAEPLTFDNVSWLDSESGPEHEVFGKALPETAVYVCPSCGSAWDDYQRKENILNTVMDARAAGDPYSGWRPTKESNGIAGFCGLGELYARLPGSDMKGLVQDYLQAKYRQSLGDENAMIVFVNSKKGEAYEYGQNKREADSLRKHCAEYEEMVCPAQGLLVTIGVDVQHDRLAIVIRARGRSDHSWLMYWGEIYADSTTADKQDPVWGALDSVVFQSFKHESGGRVSASAITIDSSDGTTSEAVYHWVRTRMRSRPRVKIMAGKGASESSGMREIFSTPRKPDHKRHDKTTKAGRYDLGVYIIGTNKAKDFIDGQLGQLLKGRGRFHYYKGVRDDYFDQMVSEVKVPHRNVRNRLVWQQRPGHPCEAWDCEVYALHAAYACRVHTMTSAQWDVLEKKVKQSDLFSEAGCDEDAADEQPTSTGKQSSWIGGSSGGSWL